MLLSVFDVYMLLGVQCVCNVCAVYVVLLCVHLCMCL